MATFKPILTGFAAPTHSPAPSRAATPLFNKYRHLSSFDFEDDPRSRARPGRAIPLNLDNWDSTSNVTTRRTVPMARFVSPANSPEPDDFEKGTHDLGTKPAKEAEIFYRVDERGDELGENSRIWRIYMDEATKADSILTEGWNRSIDVLLVFTGLFSSVLTTFIIQSYQLMIPDSSSTTNALLEQLVTLQMNAAGIKSVPSVNQGGNTGSSLRQAHWVNGLWFAALSCSLSTALISMLAKQWLQAYLPNVSGSPQRRARLRQSRYMQLEAWHVPAIINALPLLLHVALLLFFAGLIVLLWSVDIAITLATWIIVAFAYIFYLASICLPFIYPDCPYYHPFSEHLYKWLAPEVSISAGSVPEPSSDRRKLGVVKCEAWDSTNSETSTSISPEDIIDAKALAWLFTKSTDNEVRSAALQGIARLPRDFSALHILREAGAVSLVEEGFHACFHKDTTMDLRWHLTDPQGAELYCRAWMSLTRGSSEQWLLEILEPLWLLQDVTSHPDAAAIASCAVALSSFDSLVSQWELLLYLARCAAGEIQLTHATQCWLLDSIIECIVQWEMPTAVIEQTTSRAVPVLLRLLSFTQELPTSRVRSATALALYIFTSGPVDLADYRMEGQRRARYCELALQGLSAVVESPQRFGVKDSLLDLAAQELARLASPVIRQSGRFSHALRSIAKSSLSKLYLDGRIGVGIVPDSILADVLHVLFPPTSISLPQRSGFVTLLVETLEISSHPDITSWSVRLLEVLLSQCPTAVSQAFTEGDGISAVLRAAKTGYVDSRRLQIDSLRTMCAFINSCSSAYISTSDAQASFDTQVDLVFQSDFFDTLFFVLASRRTTGFKQPPTWWLSEISGYWMPALVHLCRIRPHEAVWKTVVKVVRDFADTNLGEAGYTESLSHLDVMLKVINSASESESDISKSNMF